MMLRMIQVCTPLAGLVLVGCTAIPVSQLLTVAQDAGAACPRNQNLLNLDPKLTTTAGPGGGGADREFKTFMIPAGQPLWTDVGGGPGAAAPKGQGTTPNVSGGFPDFQSALQARLNNSDLTQEIRGSAVTKKLFNALVKSFAQAQIDHAKAYGYSVKSAQEQVNEVPTSDISLRELRDFTKTVSNTMGHPKIASGGGGPGAGSTKNTFVSYFIDYYEGNFYDRFGINIAKPTISTHGGGSTVSYTVQIPDSEIASALTVTLEYLVDLIDPTPVMGNKDLDPSTHEPPSGTVFYPSSKSSKNEPEALKVGLANYRNIHGNVCGVTEDNAVLLFDAASAAGDATSSVSGLVSQSWGGAGFAFGGFLKFSLGDNQTLGTIVKTAASRLAQRAALASSYWALDRIAQGAAGPGGAKPSRASYLRFGD